MRHHTKDKGDIAAARIIADLTIKGYIVFIPAVSEHSQFDMIACKGGKMHRIQAKYSSSGVATDKTSWSDRNGSHQRKYMADDFDYYGIYLPSVDTIVYPSIKFAGAKIATTVPNSATPFHWYKDFLELTDMATKRTYKEFGVELTHTRTITNAVINARIKRRKVIRPSKEELAKLLWEKPTTQIAKDFGVSGKAIQKWAKSYGITKPPRGYWAKQK